MVAQFRGERGEMSTKVFTTSGPWRMTWLAQEPIEVVILQARTTKQFSRIDEPRRSKPTGGSVSVGQAGDFFLVISARGTYQIDIEDSGR